MAKGGGSNYAGGTPANPAGYRFKKENTAAGTKNRSRQQVLAAGLKTRGDKGGGAPLTAGPAATGFAKSRAYAPGMGGTRVFRGGNS